jgi:hypothetical protein
MAHVHGAKAATQVMPSINAGAAKMMDPAMGKIGMDSMMNEGMGSMMKQGMSPMLKEGTGPMMKMGGGITQLVKHSKTPGVATGATTGALASAGSSAGKSAIGKVFTHPLVLFGLGVAVGYFIFSYRKSIIAASEETQQEE